MAYQVLRSSPGCAGEFVPIGSVQEPGTVYIDHPPGFGTYGYIVKAVPPFGTLCGADSACVSIEAGCTPGAPDVEANSLRAARDGAEVNLRWSSTGSGRWNVHGTLLVLDLPSIHEAPATVVAAVDTPEAQHPGVSGPGEVIHYRVFGADGCTGESVP